MRTLVGAYSGNNWRELPIWALLMLNAYAPAWKDYFELYTHTYTSDAVKCIHVHISVANGTEIWEVVPFYGITNLR